MARTTITLAELQAMSDAEFDALYKQYRYLSQWVNKDTHQHVMYRIALMQGWKYRTTGNIKSFSKL